MLALVIDTSTAAVVVGVVDMQADSRTVLAERAPVAGRGHGELLSPAVAACLDDAGRTVGDVEAIVAGVGPGPYTGLRIGLATAAALAHARDVPAYAVCSLDALAMSGDDLEPDVLVVTDARRKEVYWARYAAGARIAGPHVDRPENVPVAGSAAVAGAAVDLYPDAWPADVPRLAVRHPGAGGLAHWAADKIRSGAPGDPLTPLYLRRPDATVPGAPKAVAR